MRFDIFEAPRTRSTKMIGTSRRLRPRVHARYVVSTWKA